MMPTVGEKSQASGSRVRLAFDGAGQGYDHSRTSKPVFLLVKNYLSVKQVNGKGAQGKEAVAGSLKIECSVMKYNFICASCVLKRIGK